MKEKMVEVLLKNGFENNTVDVPEAVERAFKALEEENLINFSVSENGHGGDYWLQADYYSKIGKTIIYDYDFQGHYENLDALAQKALDTDLEIKEFELKVTLINKNI
jgi:hypothetical protein